MVSVVPKTVAITVKTTCNFYAKNGGESNEILAPTKEKRGNRNQFGMDDLSRWRLNLNMSNDWRNEPATESQKEKLLFFGCTFDDGITKGQASDAIGECVKNFPERENAYQNRPATEQQRSKLRGFGKRPRASLTYGKAKELIEECENHDWQKEVEEIEKEYIIDIDDWAELYLGLTWKRVQDAAKSLDKERPGWRNESNHIHLMLGKVAQSNPTLAERWRKKVEPKRGTSRHNAKGSSIGFAILLGIIIWILWKSIFK